jgi:hypothetical protein
MWQLNNLQSACALHPETTSFSAICLDAIGVSVYPERDKHLYVCGAYGTGKSKFLENLIQASYETPFLEIY